MVLPPYSPDLSPIEELFHQVKAFLRNNQAAFHITSNPRVVISSAFAQVTRTDCCAYIGHAGYLLESLYVLILADIIYMACICMQCVCLVLYTYIALTATLITVWYTMSFNHKISEDSRLMYMNAHCS